MQKSLFCLFFFILGLHLTAQETVFEYNKFKNVSEVMYSGSAQEKRGVLELTPSQVNKRGAIWYSQRKMPVSDTFEVSFCFTINKNKGTSNQGGEGIAWVIHNNEIPNKNGKKGAGIGYANIPNSLAVELDTNDPDGQHISVQTNGIAKNTHQAEASHAWVSLEDINLKDGEQHQVHILYENPHLIISLDGQKVLECEIDLTETLNLDRGCAWVGITAATGKKHSRHEISCFSMMSKEYTLPYAHLSTGRKMKQTKRIIVHNKEIQIRLWDINQEDGDIVSLNLNGEWVVNRLLLSNAGKTFTFLLDGQVNYLVLHAHNLGEIPPNTAGITVSDGMGEVQKFTLRSNLYLSDALLIEYHQKEENEVDVTRKSGTGKADRKEKVE